MSPRGLARKAKEKGTLPVPSETFALRARLQRLQRREGGFALLNNSNRDHAAMPVNNRTDINDIARLLSRAFFHDPLFVHFFPDPKQRERLSFYTFRALVAHACHHGSINTTSQSLDGAAVWLPSGSLHRSLLDMLRFGALPALMRQGLRAVKRQFDAGEAMQSLHDQLIHEPHHYLALLGVDPTRQGRGLATGLLQPTLDQLDRDGLPCYLDTQSPDNVSLYQRFGFRVIHEGVLPGTAVPHWAMLREAR